MQRFLAFVLGMTVHGLATATVVLADQNATEPVRLAVKYFGLDAAIQRAGREGRLVCWLENAGAQPARNVELAIELPPGVAVTKPANLPIAVLHDEAEVTWWIRAEKPLTGSAKVTITGTNFPAASAQAELEFSPCPKTAAELAASSRGLPDPKPVPSDYLVGVYYFPGWKSGVHWGWSLIRDFPERKPVLGWYEEGQREVADWHIRWAVEHGIQFFAYDWYWDRGHRQLEHALHEGYLQSPYRKYLKFCLLWANHNPPKSTSEEDLLRVTRFWIDHYFKLPEYLKIDGKPVVIIFTPQRITQDIGMEAAARSFAAMRALCRAEGLEGLYLAGCTGPSEAAVRQMKQEGYDAATGYNYPSAGVRPNEGRRSPYDSAIDGYRTIWETIAGYKLMDYIPVTDPGWDSRPWHGDRALVRTGRHPAKFRKMLELARQFADGRPVGASRKKIVLVEAWNEFGEGAAIEPHREVGFGYLDAIREVFTKAPLEHEDWVPADVGQTIKQSVAMPFRTAWEFNTDGDPEGWGPMMGLEEFQVRGGCMTARTATRDPAFSVNVRFDTRRFDRMIVRMKLDKGTRAQLFWRPQGASESEQTSLAFATVPDGQFHEYLLELGAVQTWQGKITGLRLDPNSEPGAHVQIDFIRLLEKR